ncbi:hypothetical protein PMAYCL1PPCAC_27338 [Pristionchus mayeri]|uniref:Uncharacterized protein n=1 Tax=Pristionchus mayeri TaxID=1317129 RepID=A0AAN5D5C4_9BILA|nr:hypothetical protein PMAYCL1PPCAC_27336 [Pristionchus mayeri]GMR57143.1 hypothetical protein PMAYCL1PPCAC_27338 [Pristionchus mayeri]
MAGSEIVDELLRKFPTLDKNVCFSTLCLQLTNDIPFRNGYVVQFNDYQLRIVHQSREYEDDDWN